MSDTTITETIQEEIYAAFRKMKEKNYSAAEELLRNGLQKVEAERNKTHVALYYSTLGVLEKVRGDFKAAWRHYEKAEKLLPDDPSLKIIMAKLMADEFRQYDTAIKKYKQVLKLAAGSGTYEHQAHAGMAIAYLRKGDRKKAVEMLDQAMVEDFSRVTSAHHLNFEVVEAFLSRNFEVDRCRTYVEKALSLATARKEQKPIQFLSRLLESFEATLH